MHRLFRYTYNDPWRLYQVWLTTPMKNQKKKEKCIGKANTAKMAQNQNSLKCGTFE